MDQKVVSIKPRTLVKVVIVVELEGVLPEDWTTEHDERLENIYSSLTDDVLPRGVDHEMDAMDDLCTAFGGTHLTSEVSLCREDDDLLKVP